MLSCSAVTLALHASAVSTSDIAVETLRSAQGNTSILTIKPDCHPFRWQSWGAVAISSLDLGEGCHSAGFTATIHK